jgi:hypothetical protein
MRLIWSGFLMVGLLLSGMSIYERRQAREERWRMTAPTAEGGYPFPSPNGTPTPPSSTR